VPDDWAGHIWVFTPALFVVSWHLTGSYAKGRRVCNFTTNPGPDSCLDGGCPGGLLCTGDVSQFQVTNYLVMPSSRFQGQSPATIASFALSTGDDESDYYRSLCSMVYIASIFFDISFRQFRS
jgi:hypothetical protein